MEGKGREVILKGHLGCHIQVGIYPMSNGKPLKGFKTGKNHTQIYSVERLLWKQTEFPTAFRDGRPYSGYPSEIYPLLLKELEACSHYMYKDNFWLLYFLTCFYIEWV